MGPGRPGWGHATCPTRAGRKPDLPAGSPLHGAVLRALPAGLVLLALCRQWPRGAWWWRSAVLGLLNMSMFFVLVHAASQLFPSSVASTVMAVSPLTMMLIAWPLVSERPRPAHLVGAAIGLGGVGLMLLTGVDGASVPGVLASAAAMLMASFGHILAKRWSAGADGSPRPSGSSSLEVCSCSRSPQPWRALRPRSPYRPPSRSAVAPWSPPRWPSLRGSPDCGTCPRAPSE